MTIYRNEYIFHQINVLSWWQTFLQDIFIMKKNIQWLLNFIVTTNVWKKSTKHLPFLDFHRRRTETKFPIFYLN